MSFLKVLNLINRNKSKINFIFNQRYNFLSNYKEKQFSNTFINNKFPLSSIICRKETLNNYNNNKSQNNYGSYYLLGGIFGFFTKEKEEENPTIILLKRSVLLIQVYTLNWDISRVPF